jgi:hypothetical protein
MAMSTRPYVIERRIGDHTWYWTSARFATAYMAKQAWERVERKLPRGSLGIYRHGPAREPEVGVLVSAVSLDADQVQKVAGLLTVGTHEPLPDQIVDALIARRADVVMSAAAAGKDSGRFKWRRPGTGARLTPDGQMIEREPGQG